MEVHTLTPQLEREYGGFLRRTPGGLLYHSLPYRDLLQRLLGCRAEYLVAVAEETIVGALPLMFVEGERGRVYNSLPYYGSHGGILAESETARDLLAARYRAIVLQSETLAATLVENPFAPVDVELPRTHVDRRIGQITPLPAGDDPRTAILEHCEASTRRNVRKAERKGFQLAIDASYLGELREIHEDNMRAIGGRAKQPAFFEIVPEVFRENDEFDVYAVLDGPRVAAALLVFYFGQTVEYFTPAVRQEYRSQQPLALALITAMEDAARRGLRVWNWGGTWESQTGVY
ncbi:MAG: GNAT family N-acetyltransferase, partial [Planctomycetaceae bacterium]